MHLDPWPNYTLVVFGLSFLGVDSGFSVAFAREHAAFPVAEPDREPGLEAGFPNQPNKKSAEMRGRRTALPHPRWGSKFLNFSDRVEVRLLG